MSSMAVVHVQTYPPFPPLSILITQPGGCISRRHLRFIDINGNCAEENATLASAAVFHTIGHAISSCSNCLAAP